MNKEKNLATKKDFLENQPTPVGTIFLGYLKNKITWSKGSEHFKEFYWRRLKFFSGLLSIVLLFLIPVLSSDESYSGAPEATDIVLFSITSIILVTYLTSYYKIRFIIKHKSRGVYWDYFEVNKKKKTILKSIFKPGKEEN